MIVVNPGPVEAGKHALNVRQGKREHVSPHFIEGVGCWQVFRQVNDVSAIVGLYRLKICMLNDPDKWKRWIIDVQPISLGHSDQFDNQTYIGEVVDGS